ncbi:hypothetical protein ACVOMS_24985 [Bradyrhizobium guangxiense]
MDDPDALTVVDPFEPHRPEPLYRPMIDRLDVADYASRQAFRQLLAEHESIAFAGGAFDDDFTPRIRDGGADESSRDRDLRENRRDRFAARVLRVEQAERIEPALDGGESAGLLFTRARAGPHFLRRSRFAERERRDAPRNTGRPGNGKAHGVGDQQTERLVADQSAEAVRPFDGRHGGRAVRSFVFPHQGVGSSPATRLGMNAELEPPATGVDRFDRDAVHRLDQGEGPVQRERRRATLFDAAWRIVGRELGHAALDDAGYAAIGDVDRFVRDDEETLGRHASDQLFGLRQIGQAVMEVAASRTVWREASEIYRPVGTLLDQVAERVRQSRELVVGVEPGDAAEFLTRSVRIGGEAHELRDVPDAGETRPTKRPYAMTSTRPLLRVQPRHKGANGRALQPFRRNITAFHRTWDCPLTILSRRRVSNRSSHIRLAVSG